MKDNITGSINLGIKSNLACISIKLTKKNLGLSKQLQIIEFHLFNLIKNIVSFQYLY